MMKAKLPANEPARIAALHSYEILDTDPEPAFDDLTALAAHLCGAPIALISFVDGHRQWFKSRIGVDATETSRDVAFCAHGILQSEVLVVPDALQDPRFASNPLVTGDPKIRFYAGVPLVTPGGQRIGMLCVNDRKPRHLRPDQIESLRMLGRQVVSLLELRRSLAELRNEQSARKQAENSTHRRDDLLQLQQVIAVAANEAASVEEALQDGIDLVCGYTGWPIGHVCLLADDGTEELVSTNIWHLADPARFEEFRAFTNSTRFQKNVGLPGEVLVTKKPVWHTVESARTTCPRVQIHANAGIRIGFAFPILIGDEIVAVLEFFAETRTAPAERLLQVVHYVSSQLGRVLERKRAEQALRQSEEKFRTLIEASSDLITILGQDGVIRYESPSVERILGYKPEELVGVSAFSRVHPEDLAGLRAAFAEHLQGTGSAERREYRLRHKDGSWRVMEGVGRSMLHDPRVQGFLVHSRDITERQKAEERLRVQSSALEAAANGIMITDREGIVRWVNPAFTALTGFAADEVVGKTSRLLKSGQHPEAFYRDLWKTVLDGKVWRGELTNRRKDGSLYAQDMTITPVKDSAGRITHFVAIKQDVTEQKRTLETLKHRVAVESLIASISTRFANLKHGEASTAIQETVETIGTFVGVDRSYLFLLSPDGKTVDNTHEWCAPGVTPQKQTLQAVPLETFPWLSEKLLRFETVQITNAADLPPEAVAVRQLLESQQVRSALLVPLAHGQSPIGLLGFDSVRAEKAWPKEDAMLLNMIGEIFIHALHREKSENALQQSNRQLAEALGELQRTQQQVVQQERLRALGQMASGIAHDFNNALAPILGFSELLLHRPANLDDRAKTIHFLEVMNTSARDAAHIVSRLREFYRNREETDVLTPVNLVPLVGQAVSLTQPRWKDQALARGVRIRVETRLEKVPPIAGSETDLRELLTNLIFNAVDAMPEGGVITLSTRPDGNRVQLSVRDTGTGMTEQVRRRCLEPFFTTKGQAGTGLGLSMVHGIVRRHNGTIDVESEPGQGTVFHVRLPIRAGGPVTPRVEPRKVAARPATILLVDDEPLVREIEAEYLKAEGHTVETAGDGAEGLARFREARFDVVVLDRAMPVMSGDQLAAAIKELSPDTPVILLTGFGDMMQAVGEIPACVDYVLGKPVTLSDLAEAIAKAVAGNAPPRR